MARCRWTDICPFFSSDVGYSPELNQAMREKYCLGCNKGCARMVIFDLIPFTRIPVDLIPTDIERMDELVKAFRDEIHQSYLRAED